MLSFGVTNIANVGKDIYLWHRIGKTLSLFKDTTFRPYFYSVDPKGIFRTIDNKKVNKIVCSRPSDVKNRRDENSYEADILFTKRYIIDKITNFTKIDLHFSFVDIEVLTKELPNYLYPEQPISCISTSDSYTGEIVTFSLWDSVARDNPEKIETCEKILIDGFVNWIKKEQFDLILGWNFIEFDWRYLCARYKKLFGCELAEMISPIAQARYLGGKQEVEPNLIPAGISVMDYLEMYKKIYRTEPSYALDAVCQKQLKETSYKKVDFSRLSDEIKEKNINDVRRMIEIEKKLKIIEYYDELRRMSMCEWADVTWNSKMLDIILLREAKQKGIVLPSKHYGEGVEVEEIGFEGAYRRCDTGLYKGLWKLDLSSAYPMAIINFCLDISNIKNEGITINTVKFYQNENALLPTIARKLISKKDILKSQLKSTNPESEEAKDLQIKYDAIKAVVNSLFGVCGLKIFRLFDYRVAAAITFLIRDLLHYIENELKKRSIKVIYIDTDSVFIESPDNPKDLCNELVKQWAKEKYGKDKIDIEFDLEGQFEKLLVVALCHYKGYLRTKSGLKEEIKGIEVRRKDSSNFIREFQNTLIDKIMNFEIEDLNKLEKIKGIVDFINSEKERIKTLPLIDVGFPCRISKMEGYKSIPIFLRALEYTQELVPSFQKVTGDSFYWLPTLPFGKAIRKSSRNKKTKSEDGSFVVEVQSSEKEVNKDVICFDEDNLDHIKRDSFDLDKNVDQKVTINWKKVIDKSITMKCEAIFLALKWDLSLIKEIKPKKERKHALHS
jgi:DNA polymerase elongation subunit (family B)